MATGQLFVVATPIGNLDDISARALRILASVGLIAAEDTRHSRRLLEHYAIRTPLTSYHEHNERDKTSSLIRALRDGQDIALISDAGTPCISDPGYRLVRAVHEHGIKVVAVPGPSALAAALSISGLPTNSFAFHGFFPRKSGDVDPLLRRVASLGGTHVFYESPNRVAGTVKRIADRMPDAEICLVRELSKLHEETLRGSARELAARLDHLDVKGECVLVLHAEPVAHEMSDESIRAEVERLVRQGASRRDAVRDIAERHGLPRNRVYAVAGKPD